MSFAARIADPGSTIRLTVSFFNNGVLFDPFSVSDVNIFDQAVGGSIVFTATPVKTAVGVYHIDYPIPAATANGLFFFDEWTWAATAATGSKIQRYCFLTGAVGDVFASAPSGGPLTFELRFQTLEAAVADLACAFNNVAKRKELKQLSGIVQIGDANLNAAVTALDARVKLLEDA
jgi:hypothetical protein